MMVFLTACPHWFSTIGRVLILTFVSLFAASAFATDFNGPVVSILDGDTIEVPQNNRAERIRLNGIECPDYSQVAPQNELELNRTIEAAGHCFQWNIWLQGDIAAWRLRTVHR